VDGHFSLRGSGGSISIGDKSFDWHWKNSVFLARRGELKEISPLLKQYPTFGVLNCS
jgi:hypothetical protein